MYREIYGVTLPKNTCPTRWRLQPVYIQMIDASDALQVALNWISLLLLSHPVGILVSYFRVRFLVNCVFRLRMSTIIRSAMKKSEVCLILSLFTGWCTKIVEYFIFWLNTMFITFEMQRILILCSNKTHISDL